MRIDTVGHQGAGGSRHGRGTTSAWSGRRAIGSAGVAIRSANAIRALGGLVGLGRVGVATETGTLEKVLFLSRGVLCTNLLTVDALNGEALEGRMTQTGSRMLVTGRAVVV